MRRLSERTAEERRLEGELLRERCEEADRIAAPMLAKLLEDRVEVTQKPALIRRPWFQLAAAWATCILIVVGYFVWLKGRSHVEEIGDVEIYVTKDGTITNTSTATWKPNTLLVARMNDGAWKTIGIVRAVVDDEPEILELETVPKGRYDTYLVEIPDAPKGAPVARIEENTKKPDTLVLNPPADLEERPIVIEYWITPPSGDRLITVHRMRIGVEWEESGQAIAYLPKSEHGVGGVSAGRVAVLASPRDISEEEIKQLEKNLSEENIEHLSPAIQREIREIRTEIFRKDGEEGTENETKQKVKLPGNGATIPGDGWQTIKKKYATSDAQQQNVWCYQDKWSWGKVLCWDNKEHCETICNIRNEKSEEIGGNEPFCDGCVGLWLDIDYSEDAMEWLTMDCDCPTWQETSIYINCEVTNQSNQVIIVAESWPRFDVGTSWPVLVMPEMVITGPEEMLELIETKKEIRTGRSGGFLVFPGVTRTGMQVVHEIRADAAENMAETQDIEAVIGIRRKYESIDRVQRHPWNVNDPEELKAPEYVTTTVNCTMSYDEVHGIGWKYTE